MMCTKSSLTKLDVLEEQSKLHVTCVISYGIRTNVSAAERRVYNKIYEIVFSSSDPGELLARDFPARQKEQFELPSHYTMSFY
jgi:hypothetical protein